MKKRYDMLDVSSAAADAAKLRNVKLDIDNYNFMYQYSLESLSQEEQIKLIYMRAKTLKKYQHLCRKMGGLTL